MLIVVRDLIKGKCSDRIKCVVFIIDVENGWYLIYKNFCINGDGVNLGRKNISFCKVILNYFIFFFI